MCVTVPGIMVVPSGNPGGADGAEGYPSGINLLAFPRELAMGSDTVVVEKN